MWIYLVKWVKIMHIFVFRYKKWEKFQKIIFFRYFSPLWNAVLLLSFFLVFYSVRVNWRLFHAPQTKVILSKPDMGWLELQRSKKPGIFTQDALGSLFWPSVDMRSNLITSEILRWFLAGIFYPFVHQRLICHVRDVLLAHLVIQGISKIRAKRVTKFFLTIVKSWKVDYFQVL